MDVILFSQRLTRLLVREDEEGRMLQGAKEQIKHLQTQIEHMVSFLREYMDKSPSNALLLEMLGEHLDDYKDDIRIKILLLAREMIYFAHQCEMIIDTCIINIIQQKNESISCKELCDALHKLEKDIVDIELGMQQVQDESIETQAFNSSSYSETIERDREPKVEILDDKMEELLDLLIEGEPCLSVITIVGKNELYHTTFAFEAYNSNYVKNYFDCHAWVSVTLEFNPNKILEDVMKSVMPSSDLSKILQKDFQLKKTTLCDYLSNKKYFIVLDDTWETIIWDDLIEAFPDNQNGSRLLVTCSDFIVLNSFRLENGREIWVNGTLSVTEPLRIIHKDWLFIILCIGREPLITYINLPQWMSLGPYINLPFYLKPCFLYFIVFYGGIEISTRHLYQLWIAEGFIQDNSVATAEKYLEELIDIGLIQVRRRRYGGRIKACRIASFTLMIAMIASLYVEFITMHPSHPHRSRDTCKLLFDTEEQTVHISSKRPFPHLRSLVFLSSKGNIEPIDCSYISENFKLLKVLDLGAWVIEQWPVGIENLLLLRYLRLKIPSLASIPASLCNLLNLYTLDLPSSHIDHTPDEIWKMHKLRHLNFGLINLPVHPGKYCSILENLNFLSTLHPTSCTPDILGRLPKLGSLRIYGDLDSYQSVLPNSLQQLLSLESLKLVHETKTSKHSSIVLGEYQFPPTLTHLSLSNTELMDDPMPTLEKLPNLQILKLKNNSYLGRKLACCPGGFPRLEVLHLKSMLWLEEWTMGTGAMSKLQCLIINPCAYLRKLPEELWHIKTFHKLELWWPQPELKRRLMEFEDMEHYDIQIYPFGM